MATSPLTAPRGYHVTYRDGEANHCPACGRSHWHVGRLSAECAFCGCALMIPQAPNIGGGQIVRTVKRRVPA